MAAILDQRGAALLFLFLVGTIADAMIIPFMPFYIVEGLGEEPWRISLYAGVVISLTIVFNRLAGQRIDSGGRFFPLVVGSSCAFLVASMAGYFSPNYWILLAFTGLAFSLSRTFMAIMYTLGRRFADEAGIEASRFSAFMRATTSTSWMIGPAVTYLVVDFVEIRAVFLVALAIGAVRLLAALFIVPRSLTGVIAGTPPKDIGKSAFDQPIWRAAFACFFLSLAHSLCMGALPLFYVREVGLPVFAPGLAFSVKTATEVAVILFTPLLMQRFTQRRILLTLSCLALVAIFTLSRVNNLQTMIFAEILEGAYYGTYGSVGLFFMQSLARDRMGYATSLYVNTLMTTGVLAGPAVGLIGQFFDFRTVIEVSLVSVVFAIIAFYFARGEDDLERVKTA